MRAEYFRPLPFLAVALLGSAPGCGAPADDRVYLESLISPTPQLNRDADEDGFSTFDGDCDDQDPGVFPGAPEGYEGTSGLVGDKKDNDCDGVVDEGTVSFDNDGDGVSKAAGDCDDTNAMIAPGRTDGCDGFDNDCDNVVDENASDSREPNDLPEEAAQIPDITCTQTTIDFNLIPIEDQLAPDSDWFAFSVREVPQCSFGITLDLYGLPELLGQASAEIWKQTGTDPLALNPLTWAAVDQETLDTGDAHLSFELAGGTGNDSGTYFINIFSSELLNTTLCQDDVRSIFKGYAP